MKLSLKYILHILIILLLISCDNDSPQEKLLQQVQESLVIGKQGIALNLLSSIQKHEKMDKKTICNIL